jgi:biopolymer transport protein ExbD
VINVYRDGSITFDRTIMSLPQLQEALSAARGEYRGLSVLIRGDAAVPFQSVASVLGACRQAGIDEMGISVRMATADASPVR